MAEERIQLTFGGEYTAGDMFAAAQQDVKDFQKAHKDLTSAARSSINQIAKAFDDDLGGAITKTSGILSQLATGGIWGAIGSAATLAITTIVDSFKEAKEAAETFATICENQLTDAIKNAENQFKKTSDAISDAKSDADELLKVLNGDIATSSEMKVHELHIQTLQQITDDMTEAGKKVIQANEEYEAAMIRGTAAIEQAENNTTAAQEKVAAAAEKRAAAESALADISEKRAALEEEMLDNGTGWLAKRKEIQENLAKNEEMFKDGLIDLHKHHVNRQKLSVELEKLEKTHSGELERLNKALKAEEDATKKLESAKKDEVTASREVERAQQKESLARIAAADAEASAEDKLRRAEKAVADEAAAAEKAQKAADDKAYEDAQYADITRKCTANQVEAKDYIELFKTCMENGATEADAYKELQKKLNAELKERISAEKNATDAANDSASGNSESKLGKTIKAAIKDSKPKVDVNTGNVGDGVDKAKAKKDWSETQKAARATQKEMNKDVYPLMRAMKGQMPKDERKLFEQYMTNKYTKEQVAEIGKEAIRRQLLSSNQMRKELEYLRAMKEATEKQGLK